MKNGLFGVINIGASAFRMQINEFVNGEGRVLEYLVKSLSLGKDTFNKKYISLETVKESTKILSGFLTKAQDYKLSKIVVVATSGLREAVNKDFFLDYVQKNTGLTVKILDPYEELFIRYTAFINELKNIDEIEKRGVIFANVSSGNVAITINRKKTFVYAEALPFGSLRLNEIFKDLDRKQKLKAYKIYIRNMLSEARRIIAKYQPKVIFFTGSTVNILKSIFGPQKSELKLNDLKKLLQEIEEIDDSEISEKYRIRYNEAEILKAVLVTYIEIVSTSGQDKFYFSKTTFPHKLVYFYSKSYKKMSLRKYLESTLIYQGEKYNFDKNHAIAVKKHSKKLFNGLKEIHNLPAKYLNLLEISAMAHDFGYFMSPNNHEYNSYYILKSIHLPGISESDMNIIALTALMHRGRDVDDYRAFFDTVKQEDIFMLKKMVAILRVADALDASHNQSITDFEIVKSKDTISLDINVRGYTFLEEKSFKNKSKLFENVFGVKIEIGKHITN